MRIPAQAFGEKYPQELSPGQLFKARGIWALRVAYDSQGEQQGFVALEGENVGQLFRLKAGMARCFAVIQPFGWFPSIDAGSQPRHEALRTATLTVGLNGPLIVGAELSDFDPNYIAFGVNGCEVVGGESNGSPFRFENWSAELQHPSRTFESLGTIFSVNRSRKTG